MTIADPEFWQGKKVLITGHTGFKGAWLSLWLYQMGAKVAGIGLEHDVQPNLFESLELDEIIQHHECDIRDLSSLTNVVTAFRPDILFHLAAQPLVLESYKHPITTYATNVMGTANVLEALRSVDECRVAVIITTDKVYKNHEWLYPYREDDLLGGHDPYSSSKAASELVISCYRDSFLQPLGKMVASARAGNVIGGGDWSHHRLIPDLIRAWESSDTLEIRNPKSIRPWQHVLEPLSGYLVLAEKMWNEKNFFGSFNFGPQSNEAASVAEVVRIAQSVLGSLKIDYPDSQAVMHEAGRLMLDTSKSSSILGLSPRWSLSETVTRTASWYKKYNQGSTAMQLCLDDIAAYKD